MLTSYCFNKETEEYVITMVYGGKWGINDKGLSTLYGTSSQKVFVINDKTTLEILKGKILDRFNVDKSQYEISFGHLHPFKRTKQSFSIDCNDDLNEFMIISGQEGVNYNVELCVSIKSICRADIVFVDKVLADKNIDDRVLADKVFVDKVLVDKAINVRGVIVATEDQRSRNTFTVDKVFADKCIYLFSEI